MPRYCCVQYSSEGPYSMAGLWRPEALTYLTRAHALPGRPALTADNYTATARTKNTNKPTEMPRPRESTGHHKAGCVCCLCTRRPPDTIRQARLLAALLALHHNTTLDLTTTRILCDPSAPDALFCAACGCLLSALNQPCLCRHCSEMHPD